MPPRASNSQKRAKTASAAQRQPPEPAALAVPQQDSLDTSSDSSDEDVSNISEMHTEGGVIHPSASRAGSPPNAEVVVEDSITCQWGDCGVVFTHLGTLIDHIHNSEYSFISFYFNVRKNGEM